MPSFRPGMSTATSSAGVATMPSSVGPDPLRDGLSFMRTAARPVGCDGDANDAPVELLAGRRQAGIDSVVQAGHVDGDLQCGRRHQGPDGVGTETVLDVPAALGEVAGAVERDGLRASRMGCDLLSALA